MPEARPGRRQECRKGPNPERHSAAGSGNFAAAAHLLERRVVAAAGGNELMVGRRDGFVDAGTRHSVMPAVMGAQTNVHWCLRFAKGLRELAVRRTGCFCSIEKAAHS